MTIAISTVITIFRSEHPRARMGGGQTVFTCFLRFFGHKNSSRYLIGFYCTYVVAQCLPVILIYSSPKSYWFTIVNKFAKDPYPLFSLFLMILETCFFDFALDFQLDLGHGALWTQSMISRHLNDESFETCPNKIGQH